LWRIFKRHYFKFDCNRLNNFQMFFISDSFWWQLHQSINRHKWKISFKAVNPDFFKQM
jgi:hypothetical protein